MVAARARRPRRLRLAGCLLGLAVMSAGAAARDAAQSGGRPPAARAYQETLASVGAAREDLWRRYRQARNPAERREILQLAQRLFAGRLVHDIVPFWYGTRWAFEGTTTVPGEGTIACGYFVTTVLRDAGLRLERVRLAQLPSELMIRSLVSAEHVRRFSDVPVARFVAAVQQWGAGLYVVGLDMHVGFIVCEDDQISFIHASYVEPFCVVREDAMQSRILGASRYRVLGKLTAEAELARRWLAGGAGGGAAGEAVLDRD